MQNTNIEWCDHTANFWSGCTKVSSACANCYAESQAKRNRNFGQWGHGAPRAWHGESARANLLRWNKKPSPYRLRVFINSMSDWLDDEVPIDWLAYLLESIHLCPNLDFILLTKRPENFKDLIHDAFMKCKGSHSSICDWGCGAPPSNVWIGATVENQEMAEKRIPELLSIPARVRFLSCEPLLGPVNLRQIYDEDGNSLDALTGDMGIEGRGHTGPRENRIHWVIAGGESGGNARPMHPDWVRSLRDQCVSSRIPFLFKQWGEWLPVDQCKHLENPVPLDKKYKGHKHADGCLMLRVGKKSSGRLLGGMRHHEFPSVQ